MPRNRDRHYKLPAGLAKYRNSVAKARLSRHGVPSSKRARGGQRNENLPFAPPEDWYPPSEAPPQRWRIVVQPAGEGYRHCITAAEIRQRLAQLPPQFLRPLEVVQLSRMTRKKQTFPCYGMQWGSALYLYPLEESLVEIFDQPPRPNLVNETRMYGGRWVHESPATWKLIWTAAAIKDFYLNNILIHELGHLLDERNSTAVARERYAEWFAIEYGYRPTRTGHPAARRPVRRRHHRRAE